jgi:hypothetical protein
MQEHKHHQDQKNDISIYSVRGKLWLKVWIIWLRIPPHRLTHSSLFYVLFVFEPFKVYGKWLVSREKDGRRGHRAVAWYNLLIGQDAPLKIENE